MVAWSFSVLDSFETCGWRHYLTKVVKEVSEQQSEAMAWGNQVHKAMENRVKFNTPLPGNMSHWAALGDSVAAKAQQPGVVVEAEQKMALTAQYTPTTFFAKNVWVRAITDLTLIKGNRALVIDYKTGQPKPESAQLRLTAAFTFHHHPEVTHIKNSFLWLKTGGMTTEDFTLLDVPAIWQEFLPRVQRLEQAFVEQKWPKKPSGLCNKWCPVPHSRCEYRGGR